MDVKADTPGHRRFDRRDRDAIRARLLSYMQRREIGVPALHQEIATANGLPAYQLSLSTLQRFLGGKHRTNDMMVRFCQTFLDAMEEKDGGEADSFTADLTRYFAPAPGADRADPAGPPLPARLEGFVRAEGRVNEADEFIRVGEGLAPRYRAAQETPVSLLRCETLAQGIRVRETLTLPDQNASNSYEGLALNLGYGAMIILRHVITGMPRSYLLAALPSEEWTGTAQELPNRLADGFVLRAPELMELVFAPATGGAEEQP